MRINKKSSKIRQNWKIDEEEISLILTHNRRRRRRRQIMGSKSQRIVERLVLGSDKIELLKLISIVLIDKLSRENKTLVN